MLEYITNASKSVKLGIAALAAAGALTISGCQGYVGVAEEGLLPFETEFSENCNKHNYDEGTVLKGIKQERDVWLEENWYKLGCEKWECQRQITGKDKGTYKMAINDIFTCKQRVDKEWQRLNTE